MNVKEDFFFLFPPPPPAFCFVFFRPPSLFFFFKMQFVKTALSRVWTRERRGGPLYVNTGLKKKKACPVFAIN